MYYSYGTHSLLAPSRHRLKQLRYDLRKMCAYGLLERDGQRYAYRLTNQGVKGAIFLVLFQQCRCGLLPHSLFRHRPDRTHCFNTKLEAAFHKVANSIREIVELLDA